MTEPRWDAWEACEPSPDFALRTVAAATRERARSRSRAKLWTGAGVLAGMLFAGTVFGSWGRILSRRPIPSGGPSAVAAPQMTKPVPAAATSLPQPSAEPAVERGTEKPIRSSAGRPLQPIGGAHDAGAPILPRCTCEPHQILCTCQGQVEPTSR
jgi:hypothetical protein